MPQSTCDIKIVRVERDLDLEKGFYYNRKEADRTIESRYFPTSKKNPEQKVNNVLRNIPEEQEEDITKSTRVDLNYFAFLVSAVRTLIPHKQQEACCIVTNQ